MENTRLSLSDLIKIRVCRQILVSLSNIKFHENEFSSSRLTCRSDKTEKLTDLLAAALPTRP